jgi:hypothetical protein
VRRSRTIWSETNKPAFDTAASEVQKLCTALQKLRDKAANILDSPNQAKRQHDAAWAGEWATEFLSALCSLEEQTTTCQLSLPQLQFIWGNAASPSKRSLTGGIPNPKNVSLSFKKPIVLADPSWDTATSTVVLSITGYNATGAVILIVTLTLTRNRTT